MHRQHSFLVGVVLILVAALSLPAWGAEAGTGPLPELAGSTTVHADGPGAIRVRLPERAQIVMGFGHEVRTETEGVVIAALVQDVPVEHPNDRVGVAYVATPPGTFRDDPVQNLELGRATLASWFPAGTYLLYVVTDAPTTLTIRIPGLKGVSDVGTAALPVTSQLDYPENDLDASPHDGFAYSGGSTGQTGPSGALVFDTYYGRHTAHVSTITSFCTYLGEPEGPVPYGPGCPATNTDEVVFTPQTITFPAAPYGSWTYAGALQPGPFTISQGVSVVAAAVPETFGYASLFLDLDLPAPEPSPVPISSMASLDVVVAGGRTAVSDQALREVAGLDGVTASRVAGEDRYETAAALVRSRFSGPVGTVLLASGATFADALAGTAAAARLDAPLLLTAPDLLPDATRRLLGELGPTRVLLLGGPSAVSARVAVQVREVTGVVPERFDGADRYATATAITGGVFDESDVVLLVSGEGFADALAAGAAAGELAAAVLLTRPDVLPAKVAEELRRLRPSRVVIVGGPAAIGDEVAEAVEREIGVAPERVGGTDRYDTASLVVSRLFDRAVSGAIVTSGENFPDALAAGAVAADRGVPVLLTSTDRLSPRTREAVSSLAGRAS